jgi:predicted RNA-binding Zn-ribbon protein involved in translation (DUF1610 family)
MPKLTNAQRRALIEQAKTAGSPCPLCGENILHAEALRLSNTLERCRHCGGDFAVDGKPTQNGSSSDYRSFFYDHVNESAEAVTKHQG